MGVEGVWVMAEVRGVLVRPPSLCWGGTVTVMGAVTAGAVRGIGSDTEITTLVGAEGTGLETVGAVIGGNCTIGVVVGPVATWGCGMEGSCGVGTTTGSCCGCITPTPD